MSPRALREIALAPRQLPPLDAQLDQLSALHDRLINLCGKARSGSVPAGSPRQVVIDTALLSTNVLAAVLLEAWESADLSEQNPGTTVMTQDVLVTLAKGIRGHLVGGGADS